MAPIAWSLRVSPSLPRISAPLPERASASRADAGLRQRPSLSPTFLNLSIWLRDGGVSRTDVGLFALVATPYALNFLGHRCSIAPCLAFDAWAG